ncbi:MAG: sulfite exporter TauE/SafE family protein [Myxococcales bacterium]|nr:sulfite exporter TauE/SafE family protein [Myxococcales bacterium]
MTLGEGALLAGAAVLGGALNAVAGGGTFFTFPALLLSGVGPIEANATSTVALWPGSLASAAGYRREVFEERSWLLWLGLPSMGGGAAGALLLVGTPPSTFLRLLPALLLLATLAFGFGERVRGRLSKREAGLPGRWLGGAAQLAIAAYGGYFGGGMGLMMLALFALLGMREVHRMNGLKSALAAAINGTAIVAFVAARAVAWAPAAVMVAGAVAGGFGGASLARQLDPRWVRAFVVLAGVSLTVYFSLRAFLPELFGAG